VNPRTASLDMIDMIRVTDARRPVRVKRKVSAVEARKRFGEILESVFYRGDEVVIERAGKAMAVVIPTERYEALERSRERLFELIEKNWERNKDVPAEEIEQDIQKAIREVRGQGASAETLDEGGAGISLDDSGQYPDCGRLPCAVRPQKAEYLSPPDVEGDVVNGQKVAVALGKSFHLDRRGITHVSSSQISLLAMDFIALRRSTAY